MNSKVNSKVNSKWKAFDNQLFKSIEKIKAGRENPWSPAASHEDWLDSMMYGLLFGTPDEVYRQQVHAKNEAEKEGRPYTPVFWTASEAGAGPVLTLWRIE
jgi:hypothetical protein